MTGPRTLLVLGGVRAGKSAYAVLRAASLGERVAFVATAEARDAEMTARIARHRAARPAGWATIEAPLALVDAIEKAGDGADVIVVDCLNLWVANLFVSTPSLTEERLLDETGRLVALLRRRLASIVLVSNEVGWGVHPETPLGRRFRDALGLVNQAVAAAVEEVVLLVAGCPLWLKSS